MGLDQYINNGGFNRATKSWTIRRDESGSWEEEVAYFRKHWGLHSWIINNCAIYSNDVNPENIDEFGFDKVSGKFVIDDDNCVNIPLRHDKLSELNKLAVKLRKYKSELKDEDDQLTGESREACKKELSDYWEEYGYTYFLWLDSIIRFTNLGLSMKYNVADRFNLTDEEKALMESRMATKNAYLETREKEFKEALDKANADIRESTGQEPTTYQAFNEGRLNNIQYSVPDPDSINPFEGFEQKQYEKICLIYHPWY